MPVFKTQLRVRHYEMDALGHVNNAVYQHYLEQAAIEHSESLGFTVDRYRQLGGLFVLRRVELNYLRPAIAGDILEITTWLEKARGTRVTRHYQIRHQQQPDLIVTAEALWVWVNVASMRPQAIPTEVLEAFHQMMSDDSSVMAAQP